MIAAERTDTRLTVIAAGLFALALRPIGWTATAVTLGIGVAAWVSGTGETQTRTQRRIWCLVVGAGTLVFALVRWRSALPALHMSTVALGASVVAAAAEELFFRRLLYGALERYGPALAVLVSAVLFALVHAPHYGLIAFPIDLAAGLVFGWQRWATGGWTAPAATHVFANLVQAW
jgi:membrane protease YdiL (CAAX protease family)